MNIQRHFASLYINLSQQLPTRKHLCKKKISLDSETNHESFWTLNASVAEPQPHRRRHAVLFAEQKAASAKSSSASGCQSERNWFLIVAFIMFEKKGKKETCLDVYQQGDAASSRWGKSLGGVWTRGSILKPSSTNLLPSRSPITWPFTSFLFIYVCVCVCL